MGFRVYTAVVVFLPSLDFVIFAGLRLIADAPAELRVFALGLYAVYVGCCGGELAGAS